MNRAIVRNFQEPQTLLISQIAAQRDLSFDPINKPLFGFTVEAILGVNFFMHQSYPNGFERPLFSGGVHPDRHGGACTQRCDQKFIWIWSGIAAADLDRFVSQESVWSDRNLLQESDVI